MMYACHNDMCGIEPNVTTRSWLNMDEATSMGVSGQLAHLKADRKTRGSEKKKDKKVYETVCAD